MKDKQIPLVSIIITTKNEEDVIGNLLTSINNQTYQSIEIILVDNHSTDNTVKVAQKYGVKIYTFGPERSAQRNFGAKKSTGKYLLFLDADMELTPRVLEGCIKLVKEKRVSAVIIPEKSIAVDFWGKVKAFERSFYNEEGDEITDAARFFSKEVFFKVGGYDELVTGPEDWDLPETIKEKDIPVVRISAPILHHERIASLWQLARKKYYYALKANQYLKRHNIPLIGPKTIYFLRPIFYKQWQRLIRHPILTLAMFYMFFIEMAAGGTGFIVGCLKAK